MCHLPEQIDEQHSAQKSGVRYHILASMTAPLGMRYPRKVSSSKLQWGRPIHVRVVGLLCWIVSAERILTNGSNSLPPQSLLYESINIRQSRSIRECWETISPHNAVQFLASTFECRRIESHGQEKCFHRRNSLIKMGE